MVEPMLAGQLVLEVRGAAEMLGLLAVATVLPGLKIEAAEVAVDQQIQPQQGLGMVAQAAPASSSSN